MMVVVSLTIVVILTHNAQNLTIKFKRNEEKIRLIRGNRKATI